MPLPWKHGGTCREIRRIPGYENRAITIRQLNDLAIYLQRLCKAGLLKFTSDWSKSKNLLGHRVAWSLLNMYIISAEVITKVIPHSDPLRAPDEETGQLWYSWVEFLNAGKPQTPKIFLSHWWGGHFRDFMKVVENVRKDRCLSIHDGIWICTFALNQFGDDLGSSLDHCPFVNGLSSSEYVCLVVDRSTGSLSRTWCAFEIMLSAEERKTLDLYSPTGKVGVEGGASSVALLDAVEAWDIRDTDTSLPADRRQIFNRIAGKDELSGILKDGDGRPVMDRGRKFLEDDQRDPSGTMRSRTKSKGQVELAHEARLVREQRTKFETINSLVRGKVKESFAKQCELQNPRLYSTRYLPWTAEEVFSSCHARFSWAVETLNCPADG